MNELERKERRSPEVTVNLESDARPLLEFMLRHMEAKTFRQPPKGVNLTRVELVWEGMTAMARLHPSAELIAACTH